MYWLPSEDELGILAPLVLKSAVLSLFFEIVAGKLCDNTYIQ